MDKQHIIYKITNTLNDRFYVGMHSGNPDDGYLGSGKRIKREIKKYGKENFKKEILEVLPTREALELREAEIINEQLLAHPLCLNLKNGGAGGWDHLNANTPENQQRRSRAGKVGGKHPNALANLIRGRTTECAKKSVATVKLIYGHDFYRRIGASPVSDEKRKKLSLASLGKKLMHNDVESKYVPPQEVDVYLKMGWNLGRRV